MNFLLKLFFPKQLPEGLTDKERIQLPYLIILTLVLPILFIMLSILQVALGAIQEAILLFFGTVAFVITLIFFQKGKIKKATWSATIGLLFVQSVVAFGMPIDANPYALYRIAAFFLVMGVANFLLSSTLTEIILFFCVSVAMWAITIFVNISTIVVESLQLYYACAGVGIFAVFAESMMFILLFKMTAALNDHVLIQKDNIQNAFVKITAILNESKQGLDVGNILINETTSANTELVKITDVFNSVNSDTNELTDIILAMSQMSQTVVQRSEEMQAGTKEQNIAITESSQALSQISEKLSNVNEVASQRRKKMSDLLDSLKNQNKLVDNALTEVKKLKESSGTISDFIHTVEDIANQTGLLAMNASIEAAHAGVLGKGFSVIAQEIRKLSDETAQNVSNIADILKENEKIVESASDSVISFAEQSEKSSEELHNTVGAIEEILMRISEMDTGTRDVMNSIHHVVETSKRNGNIVDEVSEKVSQQSTSMEKVSDFSKKLCDEIDITNTLIKAIETALSNIEKTSKQNAEVSLSVNTALEKMEF